MKKGIQTNGYFSFCNLLPVIILFQLFPATKCFLKKNTQIVKYQ